MYIFISVEKVECMFHPDVLRKFVAHDGQAMDPMVHGRNRKWRKWNRNPLGAAFGLRCFRLSAARRRVSVKMMMGRKNIRRFQVQMGVQRIFVGFFFLLIHDGFFQKITTKNNQQKTRDIPWVFGVKQKDEFCTLIKSQAGIAASWNGCSCQNTSTGHLGGKVNLSVFLKKTPALYDVRMWWCDDVMCFFFLRVPEVWYINGFMPSYTHLYPVFLNELLTKFLQSLSNTFWIFEWQPKHAKNVVFFLGLDQL